MTKKYELTEETMEFNGRTLYRIRALKDFGDVKKGDLGGWVEGYKNLSQNCDSWVFDDAMVYDEAYVLGNGKVYNNAKVYETAEVYGSAKVFNKAKVYGNARVFYYAKVFENAKVCGYAKVHEYAQVCGNAKLNGNDLVYGNQIVDGDESMIKQSCMNAHQNTSTTVTSDNMNPSHYKVGGVETIDYIKAKMSSEQYEGYLLGNVIKYTSRYRHKNGVEDLKKAEWYLNKLIEVSDGQSS